MNFIDDFIIPFTPMGKLSSILLLLCILLLILKKRNYDLIFGLFIIAWFLCLLSIIKGTFYILDITPWSMRFVCQYGIIFAFYSSLVPAMILSVPILALSIKRGYLQLLSRYRWYVIFIMIAFIDVTLVLHFCAHVICFMVDS